MSRAPRIAFVAGAVSIALVVGAARADESTPEAPERMHFAVGYERLVLSVADSTFHGGDTLPTRTGRELGFLSPAASALDFRWSTYGRHGFGFLVESLIGGWASRDALGTNDPYLSQPHRDLVVMAWGFGIETRIPLGLGVQLRPDVTTGPQMSLVKVNDDGATPRGARTRRTATRSQRLRFSSGRASRWRLRSSSDSSSARSSPTT